MMYYVVAHSPGLLVAMMMIDLSVAGSLNPFIRMDGYWLLVDLSGVPNPHQLALVIFKKACHAGVHRFMGRDADSLKLSRSDWAILMYGMFCVGFIGWLSIVLFQQTWSHIIPDYLRLWSRVIRLSGLRAWKSNGVWIVFDLGWDTLILFGVVLFSRRILSYTIQAASSISGYVRRSL
jgi:putative peptide zinc metalloprotease protein